jgi:hypothetical protein
MYALHDIGAMIRIIFINYIELALDININIFYLGAKTSNS